jgi:GntR family transcriptional regulator
MTGVRYREIAAQLRERVALGDYGEGGSLESEAELGRRYAASRLTVRRALEILRDEGLLSSRKGSGWYVASSPVRHALGAFPTGAAALAAVGRTVRRNVLDYAIVVAPASVASVFRAREGDRVVCTSRVNEDEHGPFDLITTWLPLDVAAPISPAELEQLGSWIALQHHGWGPTHATQTITAGAASDADARALRVRTGSPLLLLRRQAFTPDGRCVAVSDHRYPGGRVRLDVEFRGESASGSADPPGLRLVEMGAG